MDDNQYSEYNLNYKQILDDLDENVHKRLNHGESKCSHGTDCLPRTLELIGLIGKDFKSKLSELCLNCGATHEVIDELAKKLNITNDRIITYSPQHVDDIYDWSLINIKNGYFYVVVLSSIYDNSMAHAVLIGNIYIEELEKYEIILLDSQRELFEKNSELTYNIGKGEIDRYLSEGNFKHTELTLVGLYLDLSDTMKKLKLEDSSSDIESSGSNGKIKAGKIISSRKRSGHKHKTSRKRSGHKHKTSCKRSGHKHKTSRKRSGHKHKTSRKRSGHKRIRSLGH